MNPAIAISTFASLGLLTIPFTKTTVAPTPAPAAAVLPASSSLGGPIPARHQALSINV